MMTAFTNRKKQIGQQKVVGDRQAPDQMTTKPENKSGCLNRNSHRGTKH